MVHKNANLLICFRGEARLITPSVMQALRELSTMKPDRLSRFVISFTDLAPAFKSETCVAIGIYTMDCPHMLAANLNRIEFLLYNDDNDGRECWREIVKDLHGKGAFVTPEILEYFGIDLPV